MGRNKDFNESDSHLFECIPLINDFIGDYFVLDVVSVVVLWLCQNILISCSTLAARWENGVLPAALHSRPVLRYICAVSAVL